MNKGFYYCHMCGSIIERDEVKQIISKDWTTGRKEKLFDVCPDCASKVEKLRLPPVNIKSRKNLLFYLIRNEAQKTHGTGTGHSQMMPEKKLKSDSFEFLTQYSF